MHRKVLCVISIFFIFFKIQLCQKLAGFSHIIIHSSILENTIRSIHLKYKVGAEVIQSKYSPQHEGKDNIPTPHSKNLGFIWQISKGKC